MANCHVKKSLGAFVACAFVLGGCGDRDRAMSSVAISLENMLGRFLLDSDSTSWRYIAQTVEKCRTDYTPKYCRPIVQEDFGRVQYGVYNATFGIAAGGNRACELLQTRVEQVMADPTRLSELRSSEELDFGHLSQVSGSSKEFHSGWAKIQDEGYTPATRLFERVSRDVNAIDTVQVDCARRKVSVTLVDRWRWW